MQLVPRKCPDCGRECKSAQGLAKHRRAHELSARGEKRCPRCGETKPVEQFPLQAGRGDGRYPYCKACKAGAMRDANARRQQMSPEQRQRYALNRASKRLGVSPALVLAMFAEQEGKCAICGGGPTGNHGRLAIDHNHATGAVRALLCGLCNLGLGAFRDRLDYLEAALAYLREHGHQGE